MKNKDHKKNENLAKGNSRIYTRDMAHISALLDIVFKYILGAESSAPLLTKFINAVERDSGFPEIEGVIIRNPFNEKTFSAEKLSVIDVRARDTEGKWYNIEVQLQSQSSFPQRSLYYWANTYSNQLEEPEHYKELDRVVAINLLNFVCFPERGPWHSCFLLTEKDEPEFVLTLDAVLHFIEIPKVGDRCETELEQWIYVLKHLGEEGNKKMKVLLDGNKILGKVEKRYKDFTADQDARMAALARKMFLIDQSSREIDSREKAEELAKKAEEIAKRQEDLDKVQEDLEKKQVNLEKKQENFEKKQENLAREEKVLAKAEEELFRKRKRLARNLKDQGVPVEEISEITELSAEEIAAL